MSSARPEVWCGGTLWKLWPFYYVQTLGLNLGRRIGLNGT